MANRRMISRRISVSTRVNAISDFAKLLYTWIIPHTDDWGRLDGIPEKVKAIVMPLSKQPVKKFEQALTEMAKVGLIIWYLVENEVFLQVTRFEDHQTGLDKRTDSRYPAPKKDHFPIYPDDQFCEFLRTSEKFLLNLTKLNLTKQNSTKHVAPSVFNFDEIWERYPSKVGKKAAEGHFNTTVKNQADWEDINRALENYARSERVQKGYVQNGSTWFNNWRDWITPPESSKKDKSHQTHQQIMQTASKLEAIKKEVLCGSN